MSHDVDVYALAEKVLFEAPQSFIDRLADALQRECDEHTQQFEAWMTEQRSLRGLFDDEKARI